MGLQSLLEIEGCIGPFSLHLHTRLTKQIDEFLKNSCVHHMFSYVPNDVPQIFNWVFNDVLTIPMGVLNSKYLIFYSKKKKILLQKF